MEQPLIQISGTVEGVIYKNEENGFAVIDIEYQDELLTAVGEFPDVHQGEEVELTGCFVNHPTFGRQFKASLCTTRLPSTTGALLKYLASGAIKGIGPVMARRIVDEFGANTLEVIEREPQRLCAVRGITPKKAEQIGEEYKRIFGIRTVMAFLTQYGLTPAESIRVWKMWGAMAQEIVTQNPYRLCCDFIGISFDRADDIARQLQMPLSAPERIRAALEFVLRHNLQNGHTCLPKSRLLQVATDYIALEEEPVAQVLAAMLEENDLVEYMVRGKSMVFLPDLYRAEGYIATRLQMMTAVMPDSGTKWDKAIAAQEKKLDITYADSQRQAISSAMRQGFVVLTGGPGTGKTTTMAALISLFEEDGKKVALCAPTGRAAKRMTDLCGSEAKTIHRLLEAGYQKDGTLSFSKGEDDLLDCDVLILDEASMVDVLLLEALLRAMKLTCKLVLVGDYDQLPSVGPGNLLKDIIDSGCFATIRLSHIFRQAAQSAIVTSAHQILTGQLPDLSRRDSDFFFLRAPGKAGGLQLIEDLIARRLPAAYGVSPGDIQILSPGRRGLCGCENLNLQLRERLNPPAPDKPEIKSMGFSFRVGDKVMQTKNNYDILYKKSDGEKGTGIFNGDMGLITHIDRRDGLVQILFDEEKTATYTADMLREIELAYAVTVHKSQGSEFDVVILSLLEPNPKLYYRNLLYTAVTRAKKLLVMVGSPQAVSMMVENNRKTLRYSGLGAFIHDIMD